MTNPRPTKITDEMRLEVARRTARSLIDESDFTEDDFDPIVSQFKEVSTGRENGYELAKKFDMAFGWSIDLGIVEIFDRCRAIYDDLLMDAQREWVLSEDIRPLYSDGQPVLLKSGETGVITGVFKFRPACYEVKIDGDADADGPMKSRRICRFEDVEVSPTPTL